MAKIRAVVVEGDRSSGYKRVQVLFGTNSFIEITDDAGQVKLLIGAHDRGVKVDGSEAHGPLAQLIHEIIERHPDKAWIESD
ncbi:MAG TPA: hypothetical protein VF130_04320 [Candidatus Binatia bacterium]